MAQISGYFKAGKPTFANSPKVKALATKPPGYPVSGYFNAAGKPTFANSPQLQGATMSSAPPAAGSKAAGQKPGTSATTTASDQGPVGPPLDATAVNNIATHTFTANNTINDLNRQSGDIGINLKAALADLAYQQPRDALKLEQGANRRGGLYSTAYDQDLGDQTHAYSTKQTGLVTTAGQRTDRINAAISAVLGGIPLYNQGQSNASTGRAITAAAANPATGQPVSLTPEQVKYIKAGTAAPKPPKPKPPKPARRPVLSTHPNAPQATRPRIIDPFAKGRN